MDKSHLKNMLLYSSHTLPLEHILLLGDELTNYPILKNSSSTPQLKVSSVSQPTMNDFSWRDNPQTTFSTIKANEGLLLRTDCMLSLQPSSKTSARFHWFRGYALMILIAKSVFKEKRNGLGLTNPLIIKNGKMPWRKAQKVFFAFKKQTKSPDSWCRPLIT